MVRLWVGAVALAGAFLGVLYVLLGQSRLPLTRRRYQAGPGRGPLTSLADAVTSLTGRILGEREGPIATALQLAGMKQRPQDFAVLVGSAMVGLFALGFVLRGALAGLALALLSPVGAWLILRIRTGRRRTAFAAQLDETLQMLAGGLRAGYSLPQAAATVATESADPTSEEFSRVINEARVGRPLVEALEDSSRRVKSDDFYWVIQAIAINREVGGNLAEVLDGVGDTIRERIHLKRQVSALAAEGKLSAIILCALPVVMLLMMSIVNPTYLSKFGESTLGILMLVVGGVMMFIGVLWMRSMVNLKF
jgi:tight adherence protein B